MAVASKPLFRPEAMRPKLSAFAVPPAAATARTQLANWAKLLGTKKAAAMKETELLADFLTDVFVHLLGYIGPAAGSERYTIKREATVEVDGKFADAALGRFSTGADRPDFIAAVEGKGPREMGSRCGRLFAGCAMADVCAYFRPAPSRIFSGVRRA